MGRADGDGVSAPLPLTGNSALRNLAVRSVVLTGTAS
jgi:hypothetical protein